MKDGTRFADLDEGRLIEELDDQGEVVQRRLEHATTGTLAGHYDGGELLQLAELWTTSDLLIEDALAGCSVAFLGACESGQSAFRVDVDEDMGLPGALQLAGVDTVVGTLWPVRDRVALLFSILFYGRLVAHPRGIIDLATLTAACRRELAGLHRDRAVALLRETASRVTSRVARAELQYVIEELAGGPDYPFAHPYNWAAFFLQGVERVEATWE